MRTYSIMFVARLSRELFAALTQEAERRGTSRSEIARQLLSAGLGLVNCRPFADDLPAGEAPSGDPT